VQNTLKPNVIAPGTDILGASSEGEELLILTGTSMSSPHMAGAAALVRAVHPDWGVAQVASALEMTATAELAKDYDGSVVTPHKRGAGRPRLGEAVNAGLFLDVGGAQFTSANPAIGGDPGNLNLSGLVDASCQASCSFSRTLTDQMGVALTATAVSLGWSAGECACDLSSAKAAKTSA
jgi:subtilisin family serine protease